MTELDMTTKVILTILYLAGMLLASRLIAMAWDWLDNMRKPTLRELCRREYGDEFAEDYDTLCEGGVIGGLGETIAFIEMVERVKSEHEDGDAE